MKKQNKKTFTIFICAALVLLSGCKSASIATSGTSIPAASSAGVSAAPDAVGSTEESIGGYVETDKTDTLPGSYSALHELRTSAGGVLEMVATTQSGTVQLLQMDAAGQWQATQESTVPQSCNALLCNMSASGQLWVVSKDANGQYELKTGQNEIDPESLSPVTIDSLTVDGAIPLDLKICADDKALLSVQIGETTVLYLLTADGTATEITPGFYSKPVFIDQRNIYAFVSGSENAIVFDRDTGMAVQNASVNLPDFRSPAADIVGTIQNGTLYYVNSNGIHKMSIGGSMLQTLADNKAFAIAGSSFHTLSLAVDTTDGIWVAGKGADGAIRLYCYQYDTALPASTDSELTVWSMQDCYLLREAVNNFSAAHPGYSVKVEYGSDSLESGMTEEDIIKALNVQIFAGDGPDVIVLDGLPIDSYRNHGLLADLSDISTSDCYENIMGCYQADGSVYALPMLFRPSLMYCKSSENAQTLATAQSLTDLQPLLNDKNSFHYDGYYNVFSELYPSASASIFAADQQSINETALREFLTVTDGIVTAQGITEENDSLFGSGEDVMAMQGQGTLGVDIPASMNWYAREQQPADCACGSTSDYLMSYITIASSTKAVPALLRPMPGNVYSPTMVMGVLNTSDMVEAGKDFISTVLTCENEDVCSRGNFNGFFVKKGIQLAYYNQRNDGSDGTPTPQQINLDAVSEQLTASANTNLILRKMVYDEAQKLYKGQQNVDTALANILQQAKLYYAEQN